MVTFIKEPRSKCPLVLVEWEDSGCPASEWQWLSDLSDWKPVLCVSVGWLLRHDENIVALAPNMGDLSREGREQASGLIRIPARAITRIVTLTESDVSVSVAPMVAPLGPPI